MDDLSKQQVVLLCVLVSFITSVGTGIITVSLLNNTPVSVTRTVDHVIERTVEKVIAPAHDSTASVAESLVPQRVVKETTALSADDAIIAAIKKVQGSIVRIQDSALQQITALGVISENDRIVTSLEGSEGKTLEATQDNKVFTKFTEEETKDGVMFLRSTEGEGFGGSHAKLGGTVELGQTVIAFGGATQDTVSVARVVQISSDSIIVDTLPVLLHRVLINLSGDVVGFEKKSENGVTQAIFSPAPSVDNN